MNKKWYNMDKDLQEQIDELKNEIEELKLKQSDNVFDSRVTFRKPVYNKFGERIIN